MLKTAAGMEKGIKEHSSQLPMQEAKVQFHCILDRICKFCEEVLRLFSV